MRIALVVNLLQAAVLNATRSVLRQGRRTTLAAGAIGFGVAALILAGGFIEWIFWAAREGTIQSGLGHVHIARTGYFAGSSSGAERFMLASDDPTLAKLKADPAVRTVAPRLSFSGLASFGDTTISFFGEGVDPDAEGNFGEMSVIVAGDLLRSGSKAEVIVGQGLAANLGAKLGDTIVLLANPPGGGVAAVEVRVRGLFATVSKAYDDSVIRAPLPVAQQLARANGAHRWVVVLKDTAMTTSMLAQLRQQFAGQPLEFRPWYEMADFYNKTVDLLSRQMSVMFAIIGVIIVLTISNSMMMSVMERTVEIGTAMALGTSRLGVLAQYLVEGAMLGVVGGVFGAVVGLTLAAIISWIGIPMPPPPGQAREFTAEMIVTVPLVLQSFALAATTALVAAVYPAWKASRVPIVDALRAGH